MGGGIRRPGGRVTLAGDKPQRYNPLSPPLWIPAFAGMTNSVAGTIHFRTNRPCRLVPAHEGMKTVALIGGVACASFATHTPPLDSRLRGNDELRGRNDENAEWRGSTARSKAA